ICNVYGPVAAACAADGNCDVGLAFPLIFRKKKIDKNLNSPEKFTRQRVRLHVLDNVRIGSGESFQLRHEIRIREETNIEHQIRIDRNSVFESKADERN